MRAKNGSAQVIYGAIRSMRTPPPFENLPVRPCPSVYFFVRLYYIFLPICPHVPPAPMSTRLLDLLPVPHCSTISLSYRHSVFTYTTIRSYLAKHMPTRPS